MPLPRFSRGRHRSPAHWRVARGSAAGLAGVRCAARGRLRRLFCGMCGLAEAWRLPQPGVTTGGFAWLPLRFCLARNAPGTNRACVSTRSAEETRWPVGARARRFLNSGSVVIKAGPPVQQRKAAADVAAALTHRPFSARIRAPAAIAVVRRQQPSQALSNGLSVVALSAVRFVL